MLVLCSLLYKVMTNYKNALTTSTKLVLNRVYFLLVSTKWRVFSIETKWEISLYEWQNNIIEISKNDLINVSSPGNKPQFWD